MPAARNNDLHGNVPDQCALALILIDVINDMEFDEGEALFANALHFMPHAEEVLARLVSFVKPGGRIVFVEYERREPSR